MSLLSEFVHFAAPDDDKGFLVIERVPVVEVSIVYSLRPNLCEKSRAFSCRLLKLFMSLV